MELKYVEDHTIFETVIGSQAYGTSTPESDVDVAGVMIPDVSYFYGLNKFEQFQGYQTDKTIFNIQKAVRLIADNNPNALDWISSPERCIIKTTPYWDKFRENTDLFISKKCKFTFMGYAIAQLKRIKTHRKYLIDPPKLKPERTSFGLKDYSMFTSSQLKAVLNIESLHEYILPDKLEEFNHELDELYADQVIGLFRKYLNPDRDELSLAFIQSSLKNQLNTLTYVGQDNFIKDEYLEEAEKEIKYQNAYSEWKKYEEWKKTRNKKRAELEATFGFDTKNALHLTRLINMGKEILLTGKVNVDRTNIDAEELKAIRAGAWTYEQVEEYANNAETEMEELYKKSILQQTPQINKINELLIDVVDQYQRDKR